MKSFCSKVGCVIICSPWRTEKTWARAVGHGAKNTTIASLCLEAPSLSPADTLTRRYQYIPEDQIHRFYLWGPFSSLLAVTYWYFSCRIAAGQTSDAPLRSAEMPQPSFGTMWFTSSGVPSCSPSSAWTATMSWRTAGTRSSARPRLVTVWQLVLPKEKSTRLEDRKWVRMWRQLPGKLWHCVCKLLIKWSSNASTGSSASNLFECYDTRTESWQVKTSMLMARCSHGSVEANGLVYVCGGTVGNNVSGRIVNNCEVYDPNTQK